MTSSIGPETGGGHIATDINKRLHLFLQPRPRLAETLPRAIRYFPMNYISEQEMKGLGVSQEHSCGTTRGAHTRARLGCLFLCDRGGEKGGNSTYSKAAQEGF